MELEDIAREISKLDLEGMATLRDMINDRIQEKQILAAAEEVQSNLDKGLGKTGSASEIIAYLKE